MIHQNICTDDEVSNFRNRSLYHKILFGIKQLIVINGKSVSNYL